jgi:hypothetical protein
MVTTVIQNFYLDKSEFRDFYAPQTSTIHSKPKLDGNKEVENITSKVAKQPKKSHLKTIIMVAAWVVAMAVGILLCVFGGIGVNSLMSKYGTLIVMGVAGFGIKIFQSAFKEFKPD